MQPYKYTPELIDGILDMFRTQLEKASTNYADGKTLAYSIESKPTIPIQLDWKGIAWLKMRALVDNCPKEIAWQGIVRTNVDRTVYTVEDILVYPQLNAAATVDMDEDKYEEWHQSLNNDQYNNLRLQGHSHVNMATSPSGTDTNMYDEMLELIRPNSFYIFMITNKKNSYWYRIFDKQNNVIYSESDIAVTVDGVDLKAWYELMSKTFVKPKTVYTYTTPTTTHTTPAAYPKTWQQSSYYYYDDEPEDYYTGYYGSTTRTHSPQKGKDYLGDDPVGFNDSPYDEAEIIKDPMGVEDNPQAVNAALNTSTKPRQKSRKGKKK